MIRAGWSRFTSTAASGHLICIHRCGPVAYSVDPIVRVHLFYPVFSENKHFYCNLRLRSSAGSKCQTQWTSRTWYKSLLEFLITWKCCNTLSSQNVLVIPSRGHNLPLLSTGVAESEVFGWSRNPKNTPESELFIRLRKSNRIIFYIALLS